MSETETELGLETVPRVIGFLSSLLERVAEYNDDRRLFQSSEKVSVFHALTRPTISIGRYHNNAYYAKVGGISTAEMNILELDFLFCLGFQLNVAPTTFHAYCTFLQREMWMQIQPPLQHLPQPSSTIERSLKIHCCLNEDESTHHHHLAV
ncbi:Cyclin-U4-3 [Hibiscus syriacus]|uniref:Cyclin-U4-3 n=1 Tax=Hibiscus syriacus TaxID=106335 RepID=A0A6A2YCQ2_HIBSY|nr:cyclin-U4-1-like isoform X1 [Hibiscus syriacus]KAE8670907.1 Cyclin-U4-3 [Hibiscus syriacus]